MANPQEKVVSISKQEMESKYQDSCMDERLKTCKQVAIAFSPAHIVAHKRERGVRWETVDGETIAIIYYYVAPDGTELKRVTLMVIDGVTYVPVAPSLA